MIPTSQPPKRSSTAAEQAPLLQATLVDLIDLSLQGKEAHWNVVGPGFKPVHEFLDELVDQYRVWYDDVAERMVAIGVVPDGRSVTVAATTSLPQLPPDEIGDHAALAAMDERVTLVSEAIARRAEEVGDHDLATQDLLIEIQRGIEKQRWMIRAHLR